MRRRYKEEEVRGIAASDGKKGWKDVEEEEEEEEEWWRGWERENGTGVEKKKGVIDY